MSHSKLILEIESPDDLSKKTGSKTSLFPILYLSLESEDSPETTPAFETLYENELIFAVPILVENETLKSESGVKVAFVEDFLILSSCCKTFAETLLSERIKISLALSNSK